MKYLTVLEHLELHVLRQRGLSSGSGEIDRFPRQLVRRALELQVPRQWPVAAASPVATARSTASCAGS